MTKKQLLKKLNLSSFIALDFETTGLSSHSDRIIEIAAIRYIDGKASERFIKLLNPGRSLSSFISELTGITNGMLSNAPNESEIVDSFLDFLGDLPIVAHNISFDIAFLNALCERHEITKVNFDLYDTLQLARIFLYDKPAFSLSSVGDYFGLSCVGMHRAEKDAELCGDIFIHLINESASHPLQVISKLVSLANPSDIPNKLLFINLAQLLIKSKKLKSGLTKPKQYQDHYDNVFKYNGNKSVDSISVQEVFGKDGLLQHSMENFEIRESQINFGSFVENIFMGEPSIGVVEAGTGSGKSLAYLFPAIKRTFTGNVNGPTIISCHTKHLQDQLFYKDLPLLARTLDVPFKAVKLKGRNNYICKTRFNWKVSDGGNILSSKEITSLLPVVVWLEYTDTGDLTECNGFWSSRPGRVAFEIHSQPGFCTTGVCSKYGGCYFGKVRRSVFDANLIIVNHALLLSEIASSGFLPSYNVVIIDEAHNLINNAYSQFSGQIDQNVIHSVLQNIDPSSSTYSWWNKRMQILSKTNSSLKSLKNNLKNKVKDGMEASVNLFEAIILHSIDRFSAEDFYTKKVIIENLLEEYGEVQSELNWLSTTLHDLLYTLHRIESELLKSDPEQSNYKELFLLLENRIESLKIIISLIETLTAKKNPEWIYWQEGTMKRSREGGKKLFISLHGSPIDISQILASQLFEKIDHCILTSATLQVEESFDYFLERAGLTIQSNIQVKTDVFPSPFYYEDQVQYFQFNGQNQIMNNPKKIADLVYSLHKQHKNRIMVLFTSHKMLNNTHHELRLMPEGRDLPVFAQGFGVSRYSILQGMKSNSRGILLGTNAFWEGIDLPGELLEILIITKLPFGVPTEPVIWAYSKMIENSGGNSFMEYSVPECIIRYRQGFGRLIRSTFDQGSFIVLDDRIITKKYGKYFLDSIPVQPKIIETKDEINHL